MNWLALVAAPTFAYACFLGGQFVSCFLLRQRRGFERAALSLAAGLVAFVLLANVLCRLWPPRWALLVTAGLLACAGLATWRRRGAGMAAGPAVPAAARAAFSVLSAAAFAGALLLGLGEVFPDDGHYLGLARLILAGDYPPHFPCAPEQSLPYHYGSVLWVAALETLGVRAWLAVDVARALVSTAALQLAFLAGWRAGRRLSTALLAAGLLLFAGQLTWLAGLLMDWTAFDAYWGRLQRLLHTPYGLWAPGSAPFFVHAQRLLTWGCAPLVVLLFLAVAQTQLDRRRKTWALGLLAGSAALLQAGVLPLLGVALLLAAGWDLAARRGATDRAPDFDPWCAGLLALAMAAAAGGPLTSALTEAFEGRSNSVIGWRLGWPRMPGCGAGDWACAVPRALDLGLVPCLAVVYAWRRLKQPWDAITLLLLAPLAGAAAVFVLRLDYGDADLARLISFAIYTWAVLLAAPLERWRRSGSRPQVGAAGLALVGVGVGGVGFLVQHVALRAARTPLGLTGEELFMVTALDRALEPAQARLPPQARIFDWSGCVGGLAPRPTLVFGRHSPSVEQFKDDARRGRAFYAQATNPDPEGIRRLGYTHIYTDTHWWRAIGAPARRRLAPAVEVEGFASDGRDFRALLRLCGVGERCYGTLPAPMRD